MYFYRHIIYPKRIFMKRLIPVVALILLFSCEEGPRGYNFESGNLPTTPVNLSDFNSEYDDYNSTAPSLGRLIPFCFSTNRNSQGNNFDVIFQPMNVNFDKTSGVLKVTNEYANWSVYQDDYNPIFAGLQKIKTTADEFGPYLISIYNQQNSNHDFLLMYATDVSGDFQINFTYRWDSTAFSNSTAIAFLNSEFDDLYPAFNDDISKIYFCSNRENEIFNIFDVDVNYDNSMESFINIVSDTNLHIVNKNTVLSSDYDDKCPYIYHNTLVFTSNRPGGFGGYDLYYSKLENGEWSAPENFGSEINSEADEYRPILFEEEVDFEKDMMVFSSNREGGMGGFDLYFVGVKK